MARTVTLSQLRSDIAAQADVVVGSSTRYTSTYLNRLINSSIQRFRERVSTEGMTHYLVATTGTMTSGATSPYAFKTLDLSAVSPNVVRVAGVDITVSNVVRSLVHVSWEARNNYGGPNATGEPEAWAMFQTTSVAIMPAPNESYFWTVWYLPLLADLSADGDTFDGVAGWEQWIVWDVVCNLIARDTYATAYALASQQRDAVWQDVIRGATKVTSAGGAVVGRDTLRATTLGRRRGDCGPVTGGSGLPPDGSVTNAMLASAPEGTTKGRMLGAGAGSPTDLTPVQLARNVAVYSGAAAGLVPTGAGSTTLFLREDGTWAAPSIGGSVSGLTLSQIQNIPEPRLLGRFSPGTGAVEALTPSQVGTMLAYFSSGIKGIVAGPTAADGTKFLRDDNTWNTPPGGAGGGVTGASPSAMFAFAPLSVLGNSASASGVSEFLNRGQVASLLPLFGTASGSTRGLVYSPTAGVANRFLRDDGSFQGVPSFTPTGILLAQLAAIPATTILGRTSPSGIPEALVPSVVATMLPVFNDAHKGLVPPASAGDTTKFLRADQTWAVPPAGGGGGSNNPGGPTGSFQYNQGSGIFAGASGFQFTASGIYNSYTLNMPTGFVRLGSGPATTGDLRHSYGHTIMSYRSQADDGNVVALRGGAVANDLWVGDTASGADLTLFAYRQITLAPFGGSEYVATASGLDLTDNGLNATTGHKFQVGGTQKAALAAGQFGLSANVLLGVPQLAHSASTDKLAAWTPSGFANVATGITLGASGYSLSVGSGGPVIHGSGADFRSSSIENLKRLNGLDGIKIFGFVSGGGAATGSQNILAPSGTVFIIPETVTAGQTFNFVSSGAANGALAMLENRSGVTHRANSVGTPSAFMSTVAPSGGTSFRFSSASGGWALQNAYQFG